ncbi:MAG: hypothetical protein M1820_003305 [Bogoriella megaspora]|nr:MAG: hypothetical protein M1820_003305 [Bogoriella megaspora]
MASTPKRQTTYPLSFSSRRKPRRWPLVLRFIKGAIHNEIVFPIILHSGWAAVAVYLNQITEGELALPNGIIPSLSIVVGLMLVFRNQTSYDRFWTGRQQLTQIVTSVRNLTRSFLLNSNPPNRPATAAERAETDHAVRTLIAMLYAIKNHLRAEWGSGFSTSPSATFNEASPSSSTLLPTQPSFSSILSLTNRSKTPLTSSTTTLPPSYHPLQTPHHTTLLHSGLSLPLSHTLTLESHILFLTHRLSLPAPLGSTLLSHLTLLTGSLSTMETIRLTPLPVAHLIHTKQVLALYCCVLPFAMVAEMQWWAVPMVSLVCFTLYGIEGIGRQLEDPFGWDRNDIRMDDVVEDVRVETEVLLGEWRKGGGWFREGDAEEGGGGRGSGVEDGGIGREGEWGVGRESTGSLL